MIRLLCLTALILLAVSIGAAAESLEPIEVPAGTGSSGPVETPAPDELREGQTGPVDYSGPEVPEEVDNLPAGMKELGILEFPDGFFAIERQGRPVSVLHDFTGDNAVELCLLVTTSPEETSLETLSDLSRLFTPGTDRPDFWLVFFEQVHNGFRPIGTVMLGRYPVVEGVRAVTIRETEPRSSAAAVTFHRTEGPLTQWVSVLNSRYTIFEMPETPTLRWIATDLDGDGALDHLSYQAGFEEGRGYETFITWYRWTENGYERYRSTNVVRNLNIFLERSQIMLSDARWERFLEYAIHPETYDAALRDGIESDALVRMVLVPDPLPGEEPRLLPTGASVLQVTMPRMRENPFSHTGRETSFEISVRVGHEKDDTMYFRARLAMSANPFAGRQFYFVPAASEAP